jgi:tetratricopeptide (TPR) repeat protein
MKRRPTFLLLASLIALFPGSFSAQPGGGQGEHSLSGYVYYSETGKPAQNVLVELRNSEGALVCSTSTMDNGEFRFASSPQVVLNLVINQLGYEPITLTLDLSRSVSDIRLELRRSDAIGRVQEPDPTVSSHVLSMPESARHAYDAGRRKLHGQKDAEGSLEEFRKAIASSPDFYEAYEQMGLAYLQMGKPEDAEKAVRKSIEVSGDQYAPADFDLSAMVMDRTQFSEGERIARHGLELDSNSWMGYYELGRALFYQNRVLDALKCAERALTLQPNAPVLYRLLANIHLSQHNDAALLQDLDAYIKLDPDSPLGIRAKQMRQQLLESVAEKSPRLLQEP